MDSFKKNCPIPYSFVKIRSFYAEKLINDVFDTSVVTNNPSQRDYHDTTFEVYHDLQLSPGIIAKFRTLQLVHRVKAWMALDDLIRECPSVYSCKEIRSYFAEQMIGDIALLDKVHIDPRRFYNQTK
jgi:hypothetical protein